MCAGGGGGGGVTIPTTDLTTVDLSGGHSVNTEQDLTEVDLQEQATEGLESITDAGTTVVEQLAEGGESLTELIDATVSGTTNAVKNTTFLDSEGKPYSDSFQAVTGITIDNPFENMDTSSWSTPTLTPQNPFSGVTSLDLTDIDLVEQLGEGAESLTELIDATISGTSDVVSNLGTDDFVSLQEGMESVTEQLDAVKGSIIDPVMDQGLQTVTDVQNFLGDVQEGVNPLEILQNSYEVLIEDPKKRLDNWLNKAEEDITETTKAIKKIPKDIGETGEEIGAAATETFQTGMETATQAGINAGTQVTQAKDDLVQALVAAGLITMNDDDDGPGNAQAILEGDPRMLSLLSRRRQARKRGKAQLRKGGGLYIPLKTGIQVPAA